MLRANRIGLGTERTVMIREEHVINGVTGQDVIDYVLRYHGSRSFKLTFKHLQTHPGHYDRRKTTQEFNCTYLSAAQIEQTIDAFYETPPPASLTLYSYLLYDKP
jgi:hypothetical protein